LVIDFTQPPLKNWTIEAAEEDINLTVHHLRAYVRSKTNIGLLTWIVKTCPNVNFLTLEGNGSAEVVFAANKYKLCRGVKLFSRFQEFQFVQVNLCDYVGNVMVF